MLGGVFLQLRDAVALLREFRVVPMAFLVSQGLLRKVFLKCLSEVHPCLVGQAEEYPKHVGHLV